MNKPLTPAPIAVSANRAPFTSPPLSIYRWAMLSALATTLVMGVNEAPPDPCTWEKPDLVTTTTFSCLKPHPATIPHTDKCADPWLTSSKATKEPPAPDREENANGLNLMIENAWIRSARIGHSGFLTTATGQPAKRYLKESKVRTTTVRETLNGKEHVCDSYKETIATSVNFDNSIVTVESELAPNSPPWPEGELESDTYRKLGASNEDLWIEHTLSDENTTSRFVERTTAHQPFNGTFPDSTIASPGYSLSPEELLLHIQMTRIKWVWGTGVPAEARTAPPICVVRFTPQDDPATSEVVKTFYWSEWMTQQESPMYEINPITLKGQKNGTYSVSLVPVDLVPGENMAGVVGDVVKSATVGSTIKHFVSPKKSDELDQEHVIVKATGITADQITPGHANQIVEWDGGEALVPAEPLKRRVKRDTAAKNEVKIRIKGSGAIAVQMNVWITWADLTLEDNTPKIQPPEDNGGIYTLKAKIVYKYICNPNAMFDTTQDIPNLNLLPDPPAPGGNHPWPPHKPLADGASVRYDATRQVRATLNSSDHVLLEFEREDDYHDIPNFPDEIAEGNDDPDMGSELMPYQGDEGIQGVMRDSDWPEFSLLHVKGLPDSTFSLHAQFRQYARVQISGKWFRCSDFKLSDLKMKFKKTNGSWGNDGSTFETGNSPFPSP